MENALNLDTVLLAEDKKHVIILDQTLLPNECKYLTLDKAEDIWEAIYALRVRGAPYRRGRRLCLLCAGQSDRHRGHGRVC